jgi:hypothetical protein
MTEAPQVLPDDVYNRELVGRVHPPDWVNAEPAGRYNLVVIGAGTAGLVTAAGAAGLGAKVALVERDFLGGDCLNVGCVPSKALIRAARAYADVRDAGAYGINEQAALVRERGFRLPWAGGAVGRSKPVSCLQQVGLGAARLVGGPQYHRAAVAGFRATARLPAVGAPEPSLRAFPPGAGPL